MTKFSSALLMVGPAQVGIFGDDLWRVGLTSQLVEGGSNGPYWLTPVTGFREKEETALIIGEIQSSVLVDSVIILSALASGEKRALGLLFDTHNVVQDEYGLHVAPYWELAPSVRDALVRYISPLVKLGLVRLDSETLMNQSLVNDLSLLNFRVQVFEPNQHQASLNL